eukprot:774968-Amphidinium_carterae.1
MTSFMSLVALEKRVFPSQDALEDCCAGLFSSGALDESLVSRKHQSTLKAVICTLGSTLSPSLAACLVQLSLPVRVRHGLCVQEQHSIEGCQRLAVADACGEGLATLNQIAGVLVSASSLASMGLRVDRSAMAQLMTGEDEVTVCKYTVRMATQLLAQRLISMLHGSAMLPGKLFGLLSESEVTRSEVVGTLRSWWECLAEAEIEMQELPILDDFLRNVLWSRQHWCRMQLLTLAEHGWKVPDHMDRELRSLARSAWCTKQTEDVIGMVRHHESMSQSKSLTPKSAWFASSSSKVLEAHGKPVHDPARVASETS